MGEFRRRYRLGDWWRSIQRCRVYSSVTGLIALALLAAVYGYNALDSCVPCRDSSRCKSKRSHECERCTQECVRHKKT